MKDVRIEFPASGATYHYPDKYGVYEYGEYPRGSVLEGQEMRSFRGRFDSLEEAKAAFPDAVFADGSGFREMELPVTAPSWFDPTHAGEHWNED